MDEIIISDRKDLSKAQLTRLLDSKLFIDIENKLLRTSVGETVKKPIEKRLADSKFAAVIKDMPTQELVVLTMLMGFSGKGLSAVSMYLNAENTSIQRYALKLELQKRENKED